MFQHLSRGYWWKSGGLTQWGRLANRPYILLPALFLDVEGAGEAGAAGDGGRHRAVLGLGEFDGALHAAGVEVAALQQVLHMHFGEGPGRVGLLDGADADLEAGKPLALLLEDVCHVVAGAAGEGGEEEAGGLEALAAPLFVGADKDGLAALIDADELAAAHPAGDHLGLWRLGRVWHSRCGGVAL